MTLRKLCGQMILTSMTGLLLLPAGVACGAQDVTLQGVTQEGSDYVATASSGSLRWGAEQGHEPGQTLTAELHLAPQGRTVQIILTRQGDTHPVRIDLRRDKDGRSLTAQTTQQADGDAEPQRSRTPLVFWPAPGIVADEAVAAGIKPRTWQDQPLHLRVDLARGFTSVQLEGRVIHHEAHTAARPTGIEIKLSQGDRLGRLLASDRPEDWQHVAVDLAPLLASFQGNQASQPLPPVVGDSQAVFQSPAGLVSLRQAQWVDWHRDPSSYYEAYDAGSYFLNDPRMVTLQIPKGDYVAAHVLAMADDDPDHTSRLTLRIGKSNGGQAQVVHYDFSADVPRDGKLHAVRIPLGEAFAQDILSPVMDVELTRSLYLARRSPDPARFRWRPAGLPSGVQVAAITFEKSPLQLRLTSPQPAHLFEEPQTPVFTAALTNISGQAQPSLLRLTTTHHHGQSRQFQAQARVEPGATLETPIPLPGLLRGHHAVTLEVLDAQGRPMLRRQTSLVVLPPDTRKHRETSVFGVTGGTGSHFTSRDGDLVGSIHHKLGLRYGMSGVFTSEERTRHGVIRSNEFSYRMRHYLKGEDPIENYLAFRQKEPDAPKAILLFHEDGISARFSARVPDLFSENPPFVFNEDEQKRFDEMWKMATTAAARFREHDPEIRILFGNGNISVRESFYKRGFPANLFDYGGNESPSFGRPPETQPPDPLGNNSSLWMDRQLLDANGYHDTPVIQGWEVTYPSTNPGNISVETQAAYLIRHAMHDMVWELPYVRPGSFSDVGNSYHSGNWGATGILNRHPELNPKPAAAAFATMTWILDGARLDRPLSMGSPSLYGVVFHRPDGKRVLSFWTVRGRRDITLTLRNTSQATLVNSQGQEEVLPVQQDKLTVTATTEPAYLVIDGDVLAVAQVSPTVHDAAPEGKTQIVDALDKLDAWSVEEKSSYHLEQYNPMTPRRLGQFKFDMVKEMAGRAHVVRVTPQPISHGKPTTPMYARLTHKQGIVLPGRPTHLGLWVHGNSSWGRILYELVDANGQRWTSNGAPASKDNRWIADELTPEMIASYNPQGMADWNTDDVFGLSRINFDGWRYISIALPGQYDGEGYHWPFNFNWAYDGDGKVAYPLTLKRIVVELPEKVLHLRTLVPPARPEIYLSGLTVEEHDLATFGLKTVPGVYQSNAQVHME